MPDIRQGLRLFASFFKIGAFTFGGGYAMVPLIEREVCEKKRWLEKDDMLEIVAIAESTPGPIAINTATYVGSRVGGVTGAALATLGVVLPSFLIIFCLSFLLERFSDVRAVRYAFFGVRAGVLALIAKALVSMYKKCPKTGLKRVFARKNEKAAGERENAFFGENAESAGAGRAETANSDAADKTSGTGTGRGALWYVLGCLPYLLMLFSFLMMVLGAVSSPLTLLACAIVGILSQCLACKGAVRGQKRGAR
jgi:chromate transporter